MSTPIYKGPHQPNQSPTGWLGGWLGGLFGGSASPAYKAPTQAPAPTPAPAPCLPCLPPSCASGDASEIFTLPDGTTVIPVPPISGPIAILIPPRG